jgi:tRNA (guanine26-N2/guanine27-N2)-dimethyltransferase
MEVTEGRVTVEAPEQPDAGRGKDVFFNERMELNRDVTVATLRAFREREPRAEGYLDATAATGVRGVRAARDGWEVTLVDRDPDATAFCRRNLDRNDLDGRVETRDTNAYLHESGGVDIVDLDPFGTPIPFADAAFANARDLVCVTATDTAPLCGAHLDSGIRSYSAVPRNTEYHPEMGLRVLLSALARTAARYDVGVTPLLSHVSDHYVRTYLELEHGATPANTAIEELGYVHHCPECRWREAERGLIANPPPTCPHCSSDQRLSAGPLWIGPAHDATFVMATREAIDDSMGTADRARRLLDRIADELHVPTHYDQHVLSDIWDVPATPMDEFIETLQTAGYATSRTHYGGTTFKTEASRSTIEEVAPPESY